MPTSTNRGTLIGASQAVGVLQGASAAIGTLSGNYGNMIQEIRRIHYGDSETLISFYLKRNNTSGVLTAVDLTGRVAGDIKFKLYNAADDVNTIPLTATGVTFSTDSTGLVHYDFATGNEIAAGYYNGFFVDNAAGQPDTYPIEPGELRIEISSDTQTAKEAYEAALV